jgi:hypothetical protein
MEAAGMVRCAHTLMRAMKEDLQERGKVEPVFVLLHGYGCDFIHFDPQLLNDSCGEAAIAHTISCRAAEVRADGALIGMDSYAFVPNMEAILSTNERLVRAASDNGLDALVRSGLGRKSEAISLNLQTPAFHLLLQQLYTRDSNGVAFEELAAIDSREFTGVPVIVTGLFNIFPLQCGTQA